MRVIWLFLISLSLYGQDAAIDSGQETDLFYQANEDYKAGNHDAAKEKYEQLIGSGFENNWQLYFNLGNAYYELNEPGRAALNYHRALRIKPKSKMVKANLEMLEGKITQKAERFPTVFYKRWYNGLIKIFSGRGWLIFAVLLAWLSCCSYAYWIYTGRRSSFFYKDAIIGWCVSLLFLFFAFSQDRYQFNKKEGVLTETEVKIKNGPSSQSKEIFSLSDGNTLTIIGQEKNWYHVRFRDGLEGWIERHSFEII